MNKIEAKAKSVAEVLSGKKYEVDYYQREYRWEEKQVVEMIDDLVNAFTDDYNPDDTLPDVERYGSYFLGSIIISSRDNRSFIVDGQQRLTTLTLLLIFLKQMSGHLEQAPQLSDLIYSQKFGTKSFNLQVPEREPTLRALFDGNRPSENIESESVANLVARYDTIVQEFPLLGSHRQETAESEDDLATPQERDLLDDQALVYFLHWLVEKVFLVEITASSDNDAYTIFETMNDRGLSLTPADMLKSFLLANIGDGGRRMKANNTWRSTISALNQNDHEGSSDFIKSWLRSQYARSIRTGSGSAQDHDFDRIGSEFHRWVRDERTLLGLKGSADFDNFITRDMDFFAALYSDVMKASATTQPGIEHIRYNGQREFTLQPMVLFAPIRVTDSPDTIRLKLRLVSMYLDILLARREWNYRRIGQSTMKVSIFNAMRQIRPLTDPEELAHKLVALLGEEQETFDSNQHLGMHMTNGRTVHRILARLTAYTEDGSGRTLDFDTLVSDKVKNRFQIEHIWANRYDRHRDEFLHEADFKTHRNRLGDLVLLPSNINQSFRDETYTHKLDHYAKQNLLLASLSEMAYKNEPGFRQFRDRTGLPFKPYAEFTRASIDERQALYLEIAKQIWDPTQLLRAVAS
jgi:uncharacterized protein with ParB-like and HNH nuclease domain